MPIEDPMLQQHKNAIFYTAILQESAQHKFSTVHTIYDVTSMGDARDKNISMIFIIIIYSFSFEFYLSLIIVLFLFTL